MVRISINSIRYYQFLLMHLDRYECESKVVDCRTLVPGLRHRKRAQSILRHALKHAPDSGPVMEFGVYRGRTIRFLANLLPETPHYGFDSFEGFPNDGRSDWQQDFRVDGKPEVPSNVTLVKGFFDKSLPRFLADNPDIGPPKLIHIDCDLYSSTKVIFDLLGGLLAPGSVIVFDELLHYHRFRENEFLAFHQFLETRKLTFKWTARSGKLLPFERFLKLQASQALPSSIKNFRRYGYHQNVAVTLKKREANYEECLGRYLEDAKRLVALYPMVFDKPHQTSGCLGP